MGHANPAARTLAEGKADPFATNEAKIAELRKQRVAKLAVARYDFIDALIEEYDAAIGRIQVSADRNANLVVENLDLKVQIQGLTTALEVANSQVAEVRATPAAEHGQFVSEN